VPVIDTDQVAREVVAPGSALLEQIAQRFGPAVLQADGSLDRRQLRALVFDDATARAELEALTHPAIAAATAARSAAAGGDYQLIAVPLLAEKGLAQRYDRVLVVDCDPAVQRLRLTLRDGISAAMADRMLAAQATPAQRLAVADDVIQNSSDLPALARQVEGLHQRYRALAAADRSKQV
jgi:dephospho-CoA kinase